MNDYTWSETGSPQIANVREIYFVGSKQAILIVDLYKVR